MGAIQQAFNQALAISALAFSPEVARRQKIRTTEKVAKQAHSIATESKYKQYGKEEPLVGTAIEALGDKELLYPEEPAINIRRQEETARAAYEINPTKANRMRLAEAEEISKIAKNLTAKSPEEGAKKAADKVAATRDQYKDQIAMLHSIAEGVRFGSTQSHHTAAAIR